MGFNFSLKKPGEIELFAMVNFLLCQKSVISHNSCQTVLTLTSCVCN